MLITSEEGNIGKAIHVMENVAALLHSLPRFVARQMAGGPTRYSARMTTATCRMINGCAVHVFVLLLLLMDRRLLFLM